MFFVFDGVLVVVVFFGIYFRIEKFSKGVGDNIERGIGV